MRKLAVLIGLIIVSGYNLYSQNTVTPAPPGFDIFRSSIPHGNIDTITYK